MIKLDKVVKQFGTQPVLRGISAEFLPGRIYGIIGENGAGKTTLFRCIADLIPYGGNISKPQRLGFLQTNNYFLPKMTGREYLRLLCQARKLPAENLDERNVFDLPLAEYAENYSTGMKKKLALLGVLLQQNELLILDEPYNGVDIQSNMLITAILLELKRLGKTVLISSHIFSTLSDTCDEIFLLREGNFAKHAQPEEFARLEREMVGKTVGDRVGRLSLR
ncbi:MAG: ATP-binding cassette domain-containing protein [Bacteroidota bacterium]